jgi:hypothetical protein
VSSDSAWIARELSVTCGVGLLLLLCQPMIQAAHGPSRLPGCRDHDAFCNVAVRAMVVKHTRSLMHDNSCNKSMQALLTQRQLDEQLLSLVVLMQATCCTLDDNQTSCWPGIASLQFQAQLTMAQRAHPAADQAPRCCRHVMLIYTTAMIIDEPNPRCLITSQLLQQL